jgi:tetratricopeptide (TPR) repeat protein
LKKAYLLLLVLILIPGISNAEIKTYTHTVKQSFGGSQSPDDARIGAITKAKREVLEKAGTYLESLTIVKNSMVEKDEILALAAGVLKAEVVSEKKFLEGNEFGIYVTAKVDVDTNILEERVESLLKNKKHLEELQDLQNREKDYLTKIRLLEEKNRELQQGGISTSYNAEKKGLKNQFQETTKGLTAIALYKKAMALRTAKEGNLGLFSDPKQALEYLNQAISLDPTYAKAYKYRGSVYYELKSFQLAIEDYNQAIKLDPTYAVAYASRSLAFTVLEQHQRAIEDANQAIKLDPNYSPSYYCRGSFTLS